MFANLKSTRFYLVLWGVLFMSLLSADGYGQVASLGSPASTSSSAGIPSLGSSVSGPKWNFYTNTLPQLGGAVGDVTGDNIKDIAVGVYPNTLYIVDGSTGGVVWYIVTPFIMNRIITHPEYDLNSDGVSEIIQWGQGLMVFSGANGNYMWHHSVSSYVQVMDFVSIVDVNNDQTRDIAVATWSFFSGGKITVYSGKDGMNLWTQSLTSYFGSALSVESPDGRGGTGGANRPDY